jgi:membrane protein YqaA with SNARE-associated domain
MEATMTVLTSSPKPGVGQGPWQTVGRIAATVIVIGLTAGILLSRELVEHLAVYGYPAVFLVSMLGNATVVLPAPSFAIVFAAGGTLNPVGVGVAAGLGAALGEMTGYLAGLSGQGALRDRRRYRRIKQAMKNFDSLAVFVLAAVPNPFFDVGGLIAGALRMPVWRFLLSCWIGKSVRFVILGMAGQILL